MLVVWLKIHPRAGDTINETLCRQQLGVFVNKQRTETSLLLIRNLSVHCIARRDRWINEFETRLKKNKNL